MTEASGENPNALLDETTANVIRVLESHDAGKAELKLEDKREDWTQLLTSYPQYEKPLRNLAKMITSTESAIELGEPEIVAMIDGPFSYVEDPMARELLTGALITRTGISTRSPLETEIASDLRGEHPHIVDAKELMQEARTMAKILGIRNQEQLTQIDRGRVVQAILTNNLMLDRSEAFQEKPKAPREQRPFTVIPSTDKHLLGADNKHHPNH
jgi:hypothetical protein